MELTKTRRLVHGEDLMFKVPVIGHIYNINPRLSDVNFVELLLTEVCRPTSFGKLRTVNNQELPYHDTCFTRGLLAEDLHLKLALKEAIIVQSLLSLGNLLANIIIFCDPANPHTHFVRKVSCRRTFSCSSIKILVIHKLAIL